MLRGKSADDRRDMRGLCVALCFKSHALAGFSVHCLVSRNVDIHDTFPAAERHRRVCDFDSVLTFRFMRNRVA